ncbi:3-oxoadipate enol-lactonase [Pseudomonadota bacterium]
MKKINANGISMNYRLDGLQSGQVVMFSNSLISSYPMWDDQVEAIGEKFQLLRYDTRGHAGTDAPSAPYSIAMFVEDVKGLLDALDIEKVHFVGLSMGGFIGQLFAATYPERVTSLALCDTACTMPPKSLWNGRIETAETEGVEGLIEGTLGRWFTQPFRDSGNPAIDNITAMIRQTGVVGYINCAKAIRDMEQCDILGKITAPTMVLVGEDDPACPVSSAQVLHKGIADSEYFVIKNAAHLPNIEKRDEFNALLLSFLKKHA